MRYRSFKIGLWFFGAGFLLSSVLFSCKEDICFEDTERFVKIGFYSVRDTSIVDSLLPSLDVKGVGLIDDGDTNYYSALKNPELLELPLNPNSDSTEYSIIVTLSLGNRDYYIDTIAGDTLPNPEDLANIHDTIVKAEYQVDIENLRFVYDRTIVLQSTACGFQTNYFLTRVVSNNPDNIDSVSIVEPLVEENNGQNVKVYY